MCVEISAPPNCGYLVVPLTGTWPAGITARTLDSRSFVSGSRPSSGEVDTHFYSFVNYELAIDTPSRVTVFHFNWTYRKLATSGDLIFCKAVTILIIQIVADLRFETKLREAYKMEPVRRGSRRTGLMTNKSHSAQKPYFLVFAGGGQTELRSTDYFGDSNSLSPDYYNLSIET